MRFNRLFFFFCLLYFFKTRRFLFTDLYLVSRLQNTKGFAQLLPVFIPQDVKLESYFYRFTSITARDISNGFFR